MNNKEIEHFYENVLSLFLKDLISELKITKKDFFMYVYGLIKYCNYEAYYFELLSISIVKNYIKEKYNINLDNLKENYYLIFKVENGCDYIFVIPEKSHFV